MDVPPVIFRRSTGGTPVSPLSSSKTRHILATLVAATFPLAVMHAEDPGKNQSGNQKQEQGCAMMGMKGKDQIASTLKDQDAELDRLVTEMSNAAPDKKLDAVVAVLTKLIEQRRLAYEQVQKMLPANEKGMCSCGMMSTDAGGDHSHVSR